MRVVNKIILSSMYILSFIFATNNDHVMVNVLEQDKSHVVIEYIISDFNVSDIAVKNEIYQDIDLIDEPDFLNKYAPKLPHINRSLIIPDLSSMSVRVIESSFDEYTNINVLPSKGNPRRNVDINKIPYIKGPVYTLNEDYPGNLVYVDDPYVLRDYRAQVLQINPFQFNPVEKVLKVYKRIVVEVRFDGFNSINSVSNSQRESKKLVKDYHYLYSDRFLNYASYQTRYNPIEEDGEMLIICYDDFCDEMNDFVNWKNQKGIKTTIVPKSQAGTTANSIKSYVQNFYNSNNLTYLLLVGDKSQIPTFEVGGGWSSGESDVSYAYLSGNDSYPEFFVGRFSANNSSQVLTQVERTIEYEKEPQLNANWYNKGLLIASNEGAGAGHDGGESD